MNIYLDHNAATAVDPRVLAHFIEVERVCPGNPGSPHGAGQRARAVLEDARRRLGAALDVAADAVTFVSSGTEANNTAIRGIGDPELPVVVAPVEHPSVFRTAEARGMVAWRVDGAGRAVPTEPDRPVGLIALVHGQSEVGTIQPIEAAAAIARSCGAPLHIDIAQSLGRIPVDLAIRLADSLTISGHKLGGLRGCAALICKDPGALRPLLLGGGQEHDRRAGTPNPALAAATALAVELAVEEQAARAAAMGTALDALLAGLGDLDCQRVGAAPFLPNTAMLRFPGIDGRNLLPALDLGGVQVSAGSACASGAAMPPRVLTAMGLLPDAARQCLRISTGMSSSRRDGERAAEVIVQTVDRLRARVDNAIS